MRTMTRKLEFDAGHRLVGHETKCRNLHGHRYVVEIKVGAQSLDEVGRVIDFGEVKRIVGGWIDEHWDHGMILNSRDTKTIALCEELDSKVFELDDQEPSVENMVGVLYGIAAALLSPAGVKVISVTMYETPNCWATYP